MAGHSFPVIAAQMRVSVSTAHNYVVEALKEITDKRTATAEQLKVMLTERLDRLLASTFPDAVDTNLSPGNRERAVEQTLKILAAIASLHGLNAPTSIKGDVVHQGLPPIIISQDDANL